MAKQENKTENCTIVNGVILTENAIKALLEYQENDNYNLRNLTIDPLSDVICLLARNIDSCNEQDKEEIIGSMITLSWIRENIKALMKP